MHLLDQRTLGIVIFSLLGTLVVVKHLATGSTVDKPRGPLTVWLVNLFNLSFLLVVNPLAAILLITRRMTTIDPTRLGFDEQRVLTVLELAGLVLYVTGFILMAGALIALGRNYQPGGSAPHSENQMVAHGPYKFIRHPMYAAALGISLGLACLLQSGALFCVFCVYLALILMLVPIEEEGLRKGYGERYSAYQQETKRILPFVY